MFTNISKGGDHIEKFEGVMINGVPLKDWLYKKEEDKKTREIHKLYKTDRRVSGVKPSMIRHRKIYSSINRKPSKGRSLTIDEIRREYGTMTKPFATKFEEIIYLVKEHPGCTPKQINDLMSEHQNPSTLSAALSTLWKHLGIFGLDILTREKYKAEGSTKDTFKYRFRVSYAKSEASDIADMLKEAMRSDYKKKRKPNTEAPNTFHPSEIDAPNDISNTVLNGLQEALSNILGVDVHVHGKVEIEIGFRK